MTEIPVSSSTSLATPSVGSSPASKAPPGIAQVRVSSLRINKTRPLLSTTIPLVPINMSESPQLFWKNECEE
jgi:hypothetical protein